jgi:hypothetical protein
MFFHCVTDLLAEQGRLIPALALPNRNFNSVLESHNLLAGVDLVDKQNWNIPAFLPSSPDNHPA